MGLYWDNGKENGTTIVYWVYIGIMEKKMETTIVYWVYIGIMEKKMETTRVYWVYIGIMEKKMETTSQETMSKLKRDTWAQGSDSRASGLGFRV